MDPKLLLQLAVAIELGSLSRAAKNLHITQPTLTRSIKIIEDRIGAPVLRRGRYGVTPTEIGERLAQQGRAVREAADQARLTVEQWRSGMEGEIRIGIGPMIAATVMPGLLKKFLSFKPTFTLLVVSAPAADIINRLNEGRIDIAVVPSQINLHQEKLRQTEIYLDRVAVFAGAKSSLYRSINVASFDELRQSQWLTSGAMSGIYGSLGDILGKLGIGDIAPFTPA